jgi:hypothetical protein
MDGNENLQQINPKPNPKIVKLVVMIDYFGEKD